MTRKEAIDKIRALFTGEMPAAADPAPANELKGYTTDAGLQLKIDKLEAGGKAFADDGTTPAAEGVYVMVDGTSVTVDATGNITAVMLPELKAEQQAAPPVMPAAFSEQLASERNAFNARFSTLEGQLKASEDARKADAAKVVSAIDQVLTLVAQFAEEPSADPIQPPADKAPAASKADRRQAIATMLAAKKGTA